MGRGKGGGWYTQNFYSQLTDHQHITSGGTRFRMSRKVDTFFRKNEYLWYGTYTGIFLPLGLLRHFHVDLAKGNRIPEKKRSVGNTKAS